jgi:ferrochelatase
MQISSVTDIVGGRLLHKPLISFITQIHTNPSKINEGDLFIAFNHKDVSLAIENGAFAILFSDSIEIIDREIAWIRVKNLEYSVGKLLRFILSSKNIKSIYCDDISFEFLTIFSSLNQNIILLKNDIKYDFELLKNIDNKILCATNYQYINILSALTKKLKIKNFDLFNFIIHSLFFTTFSYKNKLFYKVRLPSIYINHCLSVIEFLDIELDISKLKDFKFLNPLFLNKNFEIIDFGQSNKFILGNENLILVKKEIDFINNIYCYGKLIVIKNDLNDIDIIDNVKNIDFNIIYIIGKSNQAIRDIFSKIKIKENLLI